MQLARGVIRVLLGDGVVGTEDFEGSAVAGGSAKRRKRREESQSARRRHLELFTTASVAQPHSFHG